MVKIKDRPSPIDLSKITIPEGFTLAVDTREQKPLFLGKKPTKDLTIVRKDLGKYGSDYSIVGLEPIVGAERKSVEDLFGSLGNGRARFKKSLEKLEKCKYKYLLIEAPFVETITKTEHSGMHPRAIFQSVISIEIRHGIHPMYCDTRKQAEWRLLHQFVKIYNVLREGVV